MVKWLKMVVLMLAMLAPLAQAAELRDFDGKPVTLEQHTGKGKWLVVMIWASDCLICNREAESYELFHNAHKAVDASVLGISMDGQAGLKEARKFVAKHKLSFPNLIGEAEEVAVMFSDLTGAEWVGTPTFLIYNPSGKLVVQQVGAVPVNLIEAFIKRNG